MITTEEVTAAHWPQIEALFGERGACGGCWCQAWRLERGENWEEIKGGAAKERLRRGIAAGTVLGILAFAEGIPAGWCTFGPRRSFPLLDRTRSYQCEDAEAVWSIPCFYVPRPYRNRGIAHALLAAALEAMKKRGARIVEGYPAKPNRDGTYISAFAWTGTDSLFEKAGFILASDPARSKRRVRKTL
ncbi:MAG TPA: GNAT family N-acetyltransferase [bacterium]|nr:GNAT family N-acetyltransferase [bacterium]HQI49299.1 GNAT family N-acetyltransferase [bacterium]HQJ65126.1 GNAT family N-acetyltransferase [bacterium]